MIPVSRIRVGDWCRTLKTRHASFCDAVIGYQTSMSTPDFHLVAVNIGHRIFFEGAANIR